MLYLDRSDVEDNSLLEIRVRHHKNLYSVQIRLHNGPQFLIIIIQDQREVWLFTVRYLSCIYHR